MKTVVVAALIFTSFALYGENIDGTLAVDNYNVASSEPMPEETLSANIDESTSQKTQEAASAVPVSTTGYTYVEGPFVGIEINPLFGVVADGYSADGLSFGLRFGAQNLEWRTMAIIEKYNNDDYNDYFRGLLQLDYFFLGMDNLVIDSYAIRPYFGLNVGGISIDTTEKNVKSLTYGAQVGATMNLTNQLDLDIGYRYNLATSESIDRVHGATIGLHYKY